MLTNLPPDFEYGGKEIMLQAQLWNHIELTVQKAFEDRAIKAENWEKLDEIREEKLWEITDICFAKADMMETELLEKIDEIDRSKKTKIAQVNKAKETGQGEGAIDGLNEQIIEDIKQIKEIKLQYIGIQNAKLYEQWQMTEDVNETT